MFLNVVALALVKQLEDPLFGAGRWLHPRPLLLSHFTGFLHQHATLSTVPFPLQNQKMFSIEQ